MIVESLAEIDHKDPKEWLQAWLDKYDGNVERTAKRLGVNIQVLYRARRRLGIQSAHNKPITINGITATLADHARRVGIQCASAARRRLLGYPPEVWLVDGRLTPEQRKLKGKYRASD